MGSGVWLAYILPSALVIILFSSCHDRFVDSCYLSSSRVACMCDALRNVLAGPITHFFRVLMLRRKASPTETELRVEHSHMVNEALEMVDMEWHSQKTSESINPSDSRSDFMDFQAHP